MADGEIALVIGTEKLEERGLVDGDRVYLPLDVVNTYLNQRYYWDSANQQILYATPSELTSASASSEAGDKVWVKDDKVYLNLTYVQEFTDLDAYITKDPYRIAIQYKFKNVKTVTVKKNTSIRYRGGIKSAILTSVKKGTKLRLIEELEDWDQVATDDGYIGYIDKKKVGEAEKCSSNTLHDSEVINEDFHRFCLDTDKRFNLVVGNPPFIRYQYYDAEQQKLADEIFKRSKLKRTKLTNAWVTFVVGCSQLLTETSKMGFVIPSELLMVKYAQQLRQYLAKSFNKINIISFENLVFEEIQQEVVLLLCEKNGTDETFD